MLIEQSIAKQYGVLPSEQENLHYSDWAKMVSGLMDDTPLGRVVACRMEKDPEMLKHFTPEQRRIQSEWRQFRARKARQELAQNPDKQAEWTRQMVNLERMFASLAGGERK